MSTNTLDKLKTYLDALVIEVLRADQSYHLMTEIGHVAADINAKNYGELFEFIQSTLSDRFTLALSKIFDKVDRRYPTQTVSSVLSLLETEGNALPVRQPIVVLRAVRSWPDSGLPSHPSDQEITHCIIRHYRHSMPSLDTVAGCDLGRALDALKANRDKKVAHSEAIQSSELPKTTWTAAYNLLQWAKDFIGTLGWAYLSVAYTDDSGNYFLESDAMRVAAALKRLLSAAGVTDKEHQRPNQQMHGTAYRRP